MSILGQQKQDKKKKKTQAKGKKYNPRNSKTIFQLTTT